MAGVSGQVNSVDDFEDYLTQYIGNTKEVALLLDYDGTLTPIVSHPDLATIPAETKEILRQLSHQPGIFITIISGRNVNNVKEMVGLEGITYAGNHGLKILNSDGTVYNHSVPDGVLAKAGELLQKLRENVCREGAWVEDKQEFLTFHFRECPESLHEQLAKEATQIIQEAGFKIGNAHCAVEAKPPVQWDKGTASLFILKEVFGINWCENIKVIFVGDDATDEDALRVLKGNAATFRVSPKKIATYADRRLSSTDSVLNLLKWVKEYHART